MPSIRIKTNRETEHTWFAWFPVLAEKKCKEGITYHLVFLQNVRRKFLRVGGLGRWTYELS